MQSNNLLNRIENTPLALLMIVAYLFSLGMRMVWVYQHAGYEPYMWNGQLMINTNDGYFFLSAVNHALENVLSHNPRVVDLYYTATITLLAYTVKALPISLETAALYMPAVVSSLVIIPILLTGRLIGSNLVGFLGALLGSIAWSYYNRTMVGYLDTDMFSAMAPMFILYFLLAMIKTERLLYAYLAALSFLIYPFLYDQGWAVAYALGLMYIGYMLIFHRRDDFTYHSILLISIGLLNLHWAIQVMVITGLFVAITKNMIPVKYSIYMAVATLMAFFYFGNVFGIIFDKALGYFDRGVESEGLKFFQVNQTVREAGHISFTTFANRVSGSVPGVLAAILGYIILVMRHPYMVLSLPLVGIGAFALIGGLRFTVYAVPVAAISAVYLFYIVAQWSDKKILRFGVPILMSGLVLYPNVMHIIDYRVPTVMNKEEVGILKHLESKSTDKDYVIAWWDYGYPIWFYANKNTLIDGGKHSHDNFLVSQMFSTTSQLEAARLSRIAIEKYASTECRTVADLIFKGDTTSPINVGEYLDSLRYGKNLVLPEKTREVYFYLPYRMMDIFPTIRMFSNRDLNSGQETNNFFYASNGYQDDGQVVRMSGGIVLKKDEGILLLGNQKVPIKSFINVGYDQTNRVAAQYHRIHPNGGLNVVFLQAYQRFLILDDAMMQSNFIQMFVFENYDPTLFEPIVLSPWAKVYKNKL